MAGAIAVALVVALSLTIQGNWEHLWRWCISYAGQFQTRQKGFSWFDKLVPMLRYTWWQFLFAAYGGLVTLRRLREEGSAAHPDQLLLVTWLGSWVAWVMLAVPMSYSGDSPFWGMTCVFAARGIEALFVRLGELESAGRVAGLALRVSSSLLFAMVFFRTDQLMAVDLYPEDRELDERLADRYFDDEPQNLLGLPDAAAGRSFEREEAEALDPEARWKALLERPDWAQLDEPQNEYQLRVLRKIDELTAPTDAVYDNSGSYVARPHAFWFYYTYGYFFTFDAELLEREVPPALRASEAVLTVIDTRHRKLPKSLKKHLRAHYQPYNGDLWLWGMSYETRADEAQSFEFEAIRDDGYFVHPPEALEDAELWLDGQRVDSRRFELSKGVHQLRYRGPARELSILWEPHNGELWHPNRDAKARYCCRNSTR